MSREDPQMKIRLPADLKECIEDAATKGKRSLNAEIVARLQASFAPAITSANVKLSGVDPLDEAAHFEEVASRMDRAVLSMMVARFNALDGRLAALKKELASTISQAFDLQRLVTLLEDELAATDGDVNGLAHKRLTMQVHQENARIHELKKRADELRDAIAQAEVEMAEALREMRAKPLI